LGRDFSLPLVPALAAVRTLEATEENAPSLKEVSAALFSISEKPAPLEIYVLCPTRRISRRESRKLFMRSQ
jgi:hypothetical protein